MEQYVTRIGDVTIQRVIPSGGGPPEPVRVMESEELLRAVKEEPIDEDDDEGEGEVEPEAEAEEEETEENHSEEPNKEEEREESKGEGEEEEEEEEEEIEEEDEEEKIIIKQEPSDEMMETDEPMEPMNQEEELEQDETDKEKEQETEQEEEENEEDIDNEKDENSKRKTSEGDDEELDENSAKKKKVEIDVDLDKKKISNLRRNIREVMDETQLDEATLSAQRQEAERLRRVQDQQKYIREVQRQIQLNRQNSKTQSRVISLLQGGSTSILKSSSIGNNTTSTSTGPSTVLVKVGSGQQQVLNRKTLEVLRGGKSVSSSTEQPIRSGISRVTPGNKPAMVTPSVSIAPVKPVVQTEGQKKVSHDADVVTISSSSDSEDDCIVISEGEQEEEEEEEDVDPTNSGMHTNDLYNIPDENGRVLINVGKPENEAEIFLAPQIARVIKPHQIGGVRFLFDNVVESIERFNSSTGFGCILAHSMGLGKTLQVVSFCDVFLRETSAKTVMCIMPINTLQNWMAEFNMWLPSDPSMSPLAVHGEIRPRNFGIFVLNDLHKTIASRAKVIEEWNREGGVLLIGYEMYRQLSLKRPGRVRKGKKKPPDEDVEDEKNKPLLEAMHEALVRPGPDLVICDEGHRIKNSHASISHALKQIRTKRRVVLTGYPLQNNLLEYWCMVDFVRPNYLGTKTEFSNMFERPIQNGQCIDSTPQDIRLMRYRAHVLHSLLEGFVQRRSHSVLRNTLPQKEEYVLLVRMTPFQRKLYDTFMNDVVRTKAVPNPLKAFAVCCKIWNHPDILYHFLKKKEMDELQDLDLEETAALQQQNTGPNSPRRPLAKEKKGKKEVKKAQVAPIKLEVAPPPQSQPPTPDLKPEERKFDYPPNPQQQPPQGGGPPGYDYYPPPPPPGYGDMPYQYHRPPPPGIYYSGYYQDNPGYYHGYEHGYPGYYGGNFGSVDSFPAPGKPDEFSKESQNNWNNSYGNIKQEKNSPKSPKEFDPPHPKPGYQEFYPIKEEKSEIKEEKQTFLCGFSGGQVSYNYRNYPGGYPNYPYPPNDFTGWNKSGYPPFPQSDPQMPGGPPAGGPHSGPPGFQDRHQQGPPGSQSNMYSGPNQQEPHRMNAGQERPPNQQGGMASQGTQHNAMDKNQSSQNIDGHSGHLNKENKQRSHGNHGERMVGNQNMHNPQEVTHLSNQKDDHQRLEHGMYGNQRLDGNSDNLQRSQEHLMKNRNLQDNDPKHMHNTQNIPSANQQNMYNPHDNMMRNQDDYRMVCGDRTPHNQQSSFGAQANQGVQSNKNTHQQPRMQGLAENQQTNHGNMDPNSSHSQNPYNNQRNEHGGPGSLDHHMQSVALQNNQERMPGVHSNFFGGNQENQNYHDNSTRMLSGSEHFSSNQQNMFGNKRNDHNVPVHQEQHGSHQNVMTVSQMADNQKRMSGNHDNVHMSSQQNLFGSQRNEHLPQQEHGQNFPHNSDNRIHNNQGHSNLQQMFGNQRNESGSQDNFVGNQNENDNQNAKSSTSHGGFSNKKNPDTHGSRTEHQNNQQTMNMLQDISQRMNSHEQMNAPHNIYGSHEGMQGGQQGHFRGGQSTQDGQHRIPNQQHYYGNQTMDHGVHRGGEEHMSSSQSNQSTQQSHKRLSTDSSAGVQQSMYSSQSEHSIQKMISSDSHLENQQSIHSGQERSNQYNMFSPAEMASYNNQESHQANRQNMGEIQAVQETQHSDHMNRDRMLGPHISQDQKQMFNSQNIPDSRWLHGGPDRPTSQPQMFEHVSHNRNESSQGSQEKSQFHNSHEYSSHSQQNLISGGQNSQSGLQHQRSQDHLHGKQQNQNIHENQYRMTSSHDNSQDRHTANMGESGMHSNQEQMQRNSQNFMNRQNSQDHVQRQDHIPNNQTSHQNNQNIHGNQQMQQNVQVESHSSQDQMSAQLGLLGNIPGGKHGMHTNPDHSHSNQHNMGNMQTNTGHGLGHSQSSHISHDGSQGNMQNYGMQSNQQTKMAGNDSHHQSNQHGMHGSQQTSHNNQSMIQHGLMNNQEMGNQQPGSNHSMSGNQHSVFGNQFHIQNDQHSINNHQTSPHNKNNQHMQTQHGMPGQNVPIYGGGQMPMQSHNQSGNSSQSSHTHMQNLNSGQGVHPPPPMNQGHHGNQQHALHMNPNNQPYQMVGQHPPQIMHGNKDIVQSNSSPYPGSHHGQYMHGSNQQSNMPNMGHPISPHNQQGGTSHNKSHSKHDTQKVQSNQSQNPMHSQALNTNQNQPVSQQGTQTGVDNNQHRIQNMIGFQSGQHPQSHNPSFEQNIIMSNKGMSGGQVMQGSAQKHNMQNVSDKDDPNRFRSNFNEQFSANNDNYQKPGFYGQDFQYPYPGQFPYQDNQFSKQPGPSGQMFRKEDTGKDDENKQKDADMKKQKSTDENVKMSTTSTNTETDDDRGKDKKDEEEKDKKQDKADAGTTTTQKSGKEDPGIPYDWATEFLKGYIPGDIGASAKMAVFFCILEESIALGDRILVFSQSLFTLNLMEELLQQQLVPGKDDEKWARNVNYYRLDGSTTAMEREKLINEFNSNANLHLFLVSTRAGSLGINLVGANRVIVFDASWNPCHDTQAVCRVYRYGQKKPCFVYRLVTDNCLEKKIYDRQINKQGMSDRVVDECNPDAHLSIKEVTSLCWDDKEDESPKDFSSLQDSYIDVVLQRVIQKHSSLLSKEPFAHESLLVDRKEKKLSQAEKRLAKRSYELEKQASTRPVYNGVQQNQVRPKPMASVRPMQAEMGQANRPRGWIPASVWQRQGMSAQEMTLPLDVVIPTNAADRASIVLKAGQKVMVLKSPKGIYMQLENGKIIAIRTAFKVGGKKVEQGKTTPGDINQRRGIRQQLGATRGRPVRPVGPVAPVTRPPPVTVTVTRKRPSAEEQGSRKEDSQSPGSVSPGTPMEVTVTPSTPMEVTVTPEKDTPNPFTAAAAASLSTMQVSPSQQPQHSPGPATAEKQSPQTPIQPHNQQIQASPQPQQPQATVSPQPQVSVIPLTKSSPTQPQVTVQPLSQSPGVAQVPQPPVQPLAPQPPVQPQLPVLPQASVQAHSQVPVQPQPPQLPVQSSITSHVQHSQSVAPQPQHQSQASVQTHQHHPSMQVHQPQPPMQTHQSQVAPMQTHQSQSSVQTHQPLPSVQAHQQTPIQPHPSQPSLQPHQQPPTPLPLPQQQQQMSVPAHYPVPSQSQNQFPLSQTHHQQPMAFSIQSPKQPHFSPVMPQHQYPVTSQPQPFPISAQQQGQFLGHPSHPPPFPIHPQSQFPVQQPPHPMPQQPYPIQAPYPLQPHLQQSHFGAQPPHQFPLHPQAQFPMQPPQSQFEPPPPSAPVPPSMITDQLS